MVQEVDKRLEQAREAQSNYFNKHAKQLYNFKVGDLVLLSNNRQKVGEVRSAEVHWSFSNQTFS